MIYAVIDTNVFVAALLTKHRDAATAKVVEAMVAGRITAVKSPEIMAEYRDVLNGGSTCQSDGGDAFHGDSGAAETGIQG